MSIVLTLGTADETNLEPCLQCLKSSVVSVRFLLGWTGRNLGFAKTHNRNVANGDAPYVLILNPDVFVERETIGIAMGCAGLDAIVGANFGTPLWGMPDWTGAVRSSHASEHLTQRVPHIMGAFMLMRREVWNELGGFDERFSPLYYEDLDLCFRARKLGYRVWHCAGAQAIHMGGATTQSMKLKRRFWHTRNRLKFLWKWRIECAY